MFLNDIIKIHFNRHTYKSNDLYKIKEEARKKIKNGISLAEESFSINISKLYKNY